MNEQCQCDGPGFCSRFNREMRGRFYEICKGINVDIGTAAAFRMQWDLETVKPVYGPERPPARALHLVTDQSPGDTVCMTAAVYSLHKMYPGKYTTSVQSFFPEVFQHNPHVVPMVPNSELVHMHYPSIHMCNDRSTHFMQAWCEFLSSALGVGIPLLSDRPRLYFEQEPAEVEDYWLVCSGGKRDFTTKLWGQYQEVVDRLHGTVRFVQVGDAGDDHTRLKGTENMIGRTTLRQLFEMARRARGVLCGVSLLMHVAAAVQRPSIVIAGGREPVAWNAYPRQQYVHTVGMLPCKDLQGGVGRACWQSRVYALGDNSRHDNYLCQRPVNGLPMCMRMISPARIAELVFQCTYPQQSLRV